MSYIHIVYPLILCHDNKKWYKMPSLPWHALILNTNVRGLWCQTLEMFTSLTHIAHFLFYNNTLGSYTTFKVIKKSSLLWPDHTASPHTTLMHGRMVPCSDWLPYLDKVMWPISLSGCTDLLFILNCMILTLKRVIIDLICGQYSMCTCAGHAHLPPWWCQMTLWPLISSHSYLLFTLSY